MSDPRHAPRALLGRTRDLLQNDRVQERAADLRLVRWSVVWRNAPFVVGGLILAFLVVIVAFGPSMAQENPYYAGRQSTIGTGGEIISPPFAPSAQYPLGSDRWGRDMLSLLLYGARNTLIACAFVTMVRLVLGVTLGAVAGWRSGGLLDRLIMGLAEVLSSLPLLITGMILILALDIRRGLIAFLIALCVVGWGEIAQTVRAEFIALRERPFVEGARAVGVREIGIVRRHIFPNVLPTIVVVALMEMGSVLMLLGELAFVGIFIGGGARTTTAQDEVVYWADVPEWGAVLADTRGYVRSYPWLVLAPSAAFFISVLGFNLTGEGLRRIVHDAGLNTGALISKRIVLVGAVVALATWYIVGHIGPGVSYAQLALGFDGQTAATYTEEIYTLEVSDPGFGTDGSRAVVDYLAAQLEELGAQPAGLRNQFVQPVTRYVARTLETPVLESLDDDGLPAVHLSHGVDFGLQVYSHGGSGDAEGELVFVGFGKTSFDYAEFRGLDLRGRIAVVLEENAPQGFEDEALIRGAAAVIVVTDNAQPHTDLGYDTTPAMESPTLPILHVRPEAMDRLLAGSNWQVETLSAQIAGMDEQAHAAEWLTTPLGVRVHARVRLSSAEERTGYNVLAILPGTDQSLDRQALLVTTHYDLPEPDPDHAFVAVSDGPAGVGVLLETLRLWQEMGFRPRRTILISLWSGGYLSRSGADTFREELTPYAGLEQQAVLHLGSIGAGDERLLASGTGGPLDDLIDGGCGQMGIPLETGLAPQHAYEKELAQLSSRIAWAEAPNPYDAGTAQDTLDPERLEQIGNLVTYLLTSASRQIYF